jgi:ribulose 1,5-bisphosphate carboxylase large subunit-like protein/uncharacterized protein YgbK (DUF1537 family)
MVAAARVEADYIIETGYPVADAAEALAGEQSSGTFRPVPGETPELKARAAARVERIEEIGEVPAPSLPGAGRPNALHVRARITVSWPLSNMGPSLPNLMATIAGNLFELKQFSGLRLTGLRVPEAFAVNPGPAFGIEGTRRLAGVEGRPLIGTIVKPSVGLDPEGTASLVDTLCAAGIDFIKDDELQADGPHCPFEARARAVMAVIDRHSDRTGKKVMFAFNLTGEIDEMRRRHDLVLSLGGTCVMASMHSVGLTGVLALRRHAQLPIHAHRNGWGTLSRHPLLGFDYAPYAILWRLAGADHMHVNGLANKFCEPDDSVVASALVDRAGLGRKTLPRHAGFLLRPVGGAGGGHLRGARLDRSNLCRGRRDHGASGRAGGGRGGAPRGLGGGDRGGAGGRIRGGAAGTARCARGVCMRPLPESPVIAWYGDDFTGSAAVMEVLTFAGLEAVLFLDLPSEAERARFPKARAIGVAGDARTRSPDWMRAHLPPVFEGLGRLGAPILHYKICSTLDSAPHVGSIGVAAECGLGSGEWAPLLVAAPAIGRWQAFGTLFARAGGGVFRLDRHPTMSRHPVTPMDEADVRLHLAQQTDLMPGIVSLLDLKAARGADTLARERAGGARIIALDVVDEETLAAAGALIWESGVRFAIGSQGVEYALVAAWREAGLLPAPPATRGVALARQIVAVSGSCSPVTAEQIAVAEAGGFAIVPVDAARAVDASAWDATCGEAARAMLAALGLGQSVVAATARGPGDPAIAAAEAARSGAGLSPDAFNARVGTGLGRLLDTVVREARLTRAAIAGGDTSSYGARTLGLFALTAEGLVAPGAALLRGHSTDRARDGIEIALKGGQMGPPDFFVRLRDGGGGA